MEETKHVAVCPFQLTSHPGSALLLARKMAASAPDVHFSFFISENAAKANGVSVDTSEGNIHFRRVDDGGVEGKAVNMKEKAEMFTKGAGKAFRKCIDAAEKEVGISISCVVSDAFLSDVFCEIAEEKAVKWVALWTSGATSLGAHMYADILRSRFGADGREIGAESLDHYIPGFPAIHPSEISNDIKNADISSGMGRIFHTMVLKLPKADAVIINSSRNLETSLIATLNQAKLNQKLLCLGPFPFTMLSSSTKVDEDSHGCLPWLDAQLSTSGSSAVAYICFGTATSPPLEELAVLAKALESTDVPFLWALPRAHHASLPEGFADRTIKSGKGKVVPWAPQTRVLQHEAVGAHVTHCGWNSVTESILSGVPMICRPFRFADQTHNGGLVRIWGIGVRVEGGEFTESGATEAIKAVLLGEEGRKMREKIKELKKLVEEDGDGSSATDFLRLVDIVRSK